MKRFDLKSDNICCQNKKKCMDKFVCNDIFISILYFWLKLNDFMFKINNLDKNIRLSSPILKFACIGLTVYNGVW